MLLAELDMAEKILDMISDHPWPGCQWQISENFHITWMSSGIFSMIMTGVVLIAVIVPVARRYRYHPKGSAHLLDVVVVFMRDMIARPALGDRAYDFLPFLLTLFVFILFMNLVGMVPLEAVTGLVGLPPMGHTPTVIPTVCAALASLALLKIISSGLVVQAKRKHRELHWPMWVCIVLSPMLWMGSLAPSVPGLVGKVLVVPLALLELVGAVAKCFSLMIRLCANMLSGHMLLAILMVLIFQAIGAFLDTQATQLFYVGPAVVVGAVGVKLLELLVAGLQAYIFTFLTAMFLGLYAEGRH